MERKLAGNQPWSKSRQAEPLPLKSLPDPKKSKKSKNSMKTQVFGDFIVKKVKKVNENIGFLALLIYRLPPLPPTFSKTKELEDHD